MAVAGEEEQEGQGLPGQENLELEYPAVPVHAPAVPVVPRGVHPVVDSPVVDNQPVVEDILAEELDIVPVDNLVVVGTPAAGVALDTDPAGNLVEVGIPVEVVLDTVLEDILVEGT